MGTAADVRLSVLVGVVLFPATGLHQSPSDGGHVASAWTVQVFPLRVQLLSNDQRSFFQ